MKLFIVARLFGYGYPRMLSIFLHTMTSHGVLPPCVLISMDTCLCLCGNPQLISPPGVYAMYLESFELFIEQVCRTWVVQPVRYFLTSMVNKVARCLSDVLRELLPSIKQSYCIYLLRALINHEPLAKLPHKSCILTLIISWYTLRCSRRDILSYPP